MDSVLILRKDTFSLIELNTKGNHVTIQKCSSGPCAPLSGSLITVEAATDLFQKILDIEAIRKTKFSIVFTPGSGIAYKTWQAVHSSLVDISDKMAVEREERILSLCMENIPDGITELYDNYTPSVVSCYEDDTSTVTSCYIPALYLNNLKAACDVLGITLFKVTDTASCLYKVIDCNDGPLFVRYPGLISAINSFGIMCWQTPENYSDEMLQYFASLSERFYPLQDVLGHSNSISIEDVSNYLKVSIEGNTDFTLEDAVLASGCVAESKQLKITQNAENSGQKEKGDAIESVIGQLRKLFNQK